MDSGIYRLTYRTGETYVGKSIHLQTRWKQHFDKLSKGKAAKNMQDAYYASNHHYPKTEVLLYCHPDMLDYYEGYFINYLKPGLNTSIPSELPERSKEVLIEHANQGFAKHSLVTMLEVANNFSAKIIDLEAEKVKYQQEFEELELDYDELSQAWHDRAIRDAWANREYQEMWESCEQLSAECGSLGSKVQELETWKLQVFGAIWWQRLWRTW